jgi:hypothetical protein
MRKKSDTMDFYPLVLLLIFGGVGPGRVRFLRLAANQVFSDRKPGCGRKDGS